MINLSNNIKGGVWCRLLSLKISLHLLLHYGNTHDLWYINYASGGKEYKLFLPTHRCILTTRVLREKNK